MKMSVIIYLKYLEAMYQPMTVLHLGGLCCSSFKHYSVLPSEFVPLQSSQSHLE